MGGNAAQALEAITGHDFGTDPDAWQTWKDEEQSS
jgi:hypothetical protein